MATQVILLPGGVMPAELAYADLLRALGRDVAAVAKELEMYVGAFPPTGYKLERELDGILRVARDSGFERFHLVGYSGGGACSLAFAAEYPDRLLSLALIEPAWIGNDELSTQEAEIWQEFERVAMLRPQQVMAAFVANQLALGVEPPAPGPSPRWMASRPAALPVFIRTFRSTKLDLDRLRAFKQPVLYALGGKSNPNYYAQMAMRASKIFPSFKLVTFPERHHFDPPHLTEPERTAAILRTHWARAGD